MIKFGIYDIHDEFESFDTDSQDSSKHGYITLYQDQKIYDIQGNLPEYVKRKLSDLTEAKGYKYWLNAHLTGKRRDVDFDNLDQYFVGR